MTADGEPAPQAVTPLPVQPVLEYATRDADGLPDVVPEAEALIARGKPPNAIRRYFRNADEAVRYFAKSMSRRYAADTLGDACAGCSGEKTPFALQIQWVAKASAKFTEVRLSSSEATATFPTVHPVCESCLSLWLTRVARLSRPMQWLRWGQTALAALFALYVVSSMVPALRAFLLIPLPRRTPWALWFIAVAGVLLVGRGCLFVLWRLRLPRAMKRLMPRGVALGGITAVFAREGGTLRSLTD